METVTKKEKILVSIAKVKIEIDDYKVPQKNMTEFAKGIAYLLNAQALTTNPIEFNMNCEIIVAAMKMMRGEM